MLRFTLVFLLFFTAACTNKEKIKERRELANLHLKIGTGYLKQGNYPLAIRELELAKKLDPKSASIYNNLGLAYFLRTEAPLALTQFKEALKIHPSYTEARNNLARVYIETKNYSAAIETLQVATKDLTYPHPEKIWTNLGYAYLMSKNYTLAKSSLNKAISLNRHYCPAYTMHGKALFEEKKFNQAVKSLDQAILKCKRQHFAEPVYYSALSHLKLGKTENARAKLHEIINKYPESSFAQKAQSILKMIQ